MKLFIFLFTLTCFTVSANIYNRDAEALLNDNKGVLDSIGSSGFAEKEVPGYKDIDQSKLNNLKDFYKNSDQMEGRSRTTENEAANVVYEGQKIRPKVNIDRNKDPIFKRHFERIDQSHSITQTYKDCEEIPYGQEDMTKYKERKCFSIGKRDDVNFSCKKKAYYTCKNNDTGAIKAFPLSGFKIDGPHFPLRGSDGFTFYFGNPHNYRDHYSSYCGHLVNTISFYVDKEELRELRITHIQYDDGMFVKVNGAYVFKGVGKNQGLHLSKPRGRCEHYFTFSAGNIDIKNHIKQGMNTITVDHFFNGGGHAYLVLRMRSQVKCVPKENIKYECNGKSRFDGTLASSSCVSGRATRDIKGTKVTRDCWEWLENYIKKGNVYYVKDKLCRDIEANGCGEISSSCVEQREFCRKKEIKYSCPYQVSAGTVTLCGNDLFCPDGVCAKEYQGYSPATEDFKKAAAYLGLISELGKEVSKDKLIIFNGVNKQCKDRQLNYQKCCNDSGWGVSLKLTQCKGEEKELIIAQKDGRVHHVGNYETGGGLFNLKKKYYKSFCVFPSKLSRILIVGARKQLGIAFGDPKSPNCEGLKPYELEKVDFDKIDLKELYKDYANANTKLPNVKESVQKLKNKLQQSWKKREKK